ncbi:MAG: YdeI/OmpD-associated family protein [Bacteroidota bacterium]
MEKQIFEAVLQTDPKWKNSCFVHIPFSVEEVYGTKGQVKVKVWFDEVPYRGSIANMGSGHMLILRKDIRAKVGKGPGDTIKVTVMRDTEERVVEVPEALQALLDEHPEAKSFYEGLAYTYRKEYANWIRDAKREATKERRLAKTLDNLLNGVKAP